MHGIRAVLLLLAAIAQAVFAFYPGLVGIEGDIGSTAERERTALVPAGIAFAIWLFLYAGCFYVAIWHAAARRRDPVAARVGWLALGTFTASALWALHQPVFGPGLGSFALLEVILVLAFTAALSGRADPAPGQADRAAYGALLALAGWITVATPAGFSLALRTTGIAEIGREVDATSLMILFSWLPIAWALALVARAWAFVVPILWGLFWVGMANANDVVFAGGVWAVATSFIGVTAFAKRRGSAGR